MSLHTLSLEAGGSDAPTRKGCVIRNEPGVDSVMLCYLNVCFEFGLTSNILHFFFESF